ncbi:class I SAM-dependent methyltransferase [Natronorubrum texcoconense]|uniref:Methyltransferase domain-containing protein n=1 Tax=Natronorubrum texcoconense TaxID=1095776 RepID=A0A1G8WQJ2_9EURY|nr:class I SAM-dependent methyltransferase [Natronorubrum texcoconense]SDJ80638.1 Methyltransferase domain-containing protein [Natronorubrum texcoconense]
MHRLDLWFKQELDDDELREIAETIREEYPEATEKIDNALAEQGAIAELLRSSPEYVSVDAFAMWEKLGIHVTPVHWSSPIPDVHSLPDVWEEPSDLPGINLRVDEQFELLSTFESKYKNEYDEFALIESSDEHSGFAIKNRYFESVDAEIAYSMVREHSPECILEIGGGNSTQVLDAALQRNEQECDHYVIDPSPTRSIKRHTDAEVVKENVQDVPVSVFESLSENDIVFIDSSHIATIGSDVLYEFLEALPRLGDGVLVHVHDIFIPYQYPRRWITERRWFFNEQYLVRALLTNNDDLEVLWTTYYMHRKHPDRLAEAFESYDEIGQEYESGNIYGIPSSLWLRTTK